MTKIRDDHIDLYRPEKIYWTKSLEYAKTLAPNDTPMEFHCFWRVPKELSRKHVAVLKSIIVNNPKGTKINLWSNVDLSTNPMLTDLASFITHRIWNIREETKNTVLENSDVLNNIDDALCYLEGDLFRLLILHKYGGFYIDMDVLVLRDMSPLNHIEFLYQWGTSGFNSAEPTITMNGAVMRLEKGSPLSLEFLEKLSECPKDKNTNSWGNRLYSKATNGSLYVLPGVWFNSEWGYEGTHIDPFVNTGSVELFDGAFTWHWHNRWDQDIQEGSKFEVLEKLHDQKFKSLISF